MLSHLHLWCPIVVRLQQIRRLKYLCFYNQVYCISILCIALVTARQVQQFYFGLSSVGFMPLEKRTVGKDGNYHPDVNPMNHRRFWFPTLSTIPASPQSSNCCRNCVFYMRLVSIVLVRNISPHHLVYRALIVSSSVFAVPFVLWR